MEHEMIYNGEVVATAVQEFFFASLDGDKPKPIRPLKVLTDQLSE